MTEPVRRSVTVAAGLDRAFAVFTSGMDRWWPRQGKSIGSAPLAEVVLEPFAGGRWFERSIDGSECDWGQVLSFEPPHRLLLAWQLGADWRYHPELITEVEVRFTEQAGKTTVQLEHRNLDRYAEHAQRMREAYDSPDGWQGLLDGYAAAAEPIRFDRHTLMLLRRPPDAPAQTPAQAAELQDQHLAFIADRVAAGEILAVGPAADQDDQSLRGLAVWSVEPERARQLSQADPAVRAGWLTVELTDWLVPAGMLTWHPVRVPRSTADV
jgi:uncharacterized protein YndB with AHSA1/START domain/uncharacterized protein YciI